MDPKTFLELTEAALLKDIGERLHTFFAPDTVEYKKAEGDRAGLTIAEGDELYDKVVTKNPRSAILPLAQVNMVANVTVHLMAQQLAVLFYQRKEIDRTKVFETTIDNIRRMTAHYMKLVGEESENEDNGKRPLSGPADLQ